SSQILGDLQQLNAVDRLQDGTVPLVLWLKNAISLVEPRAEKSIFVESLRALGHSQTTSSDVETSSREGRDHNIAPGMSSTEVQVAHIKWKTIFRCVLVASLGGILISLFGMIAAIAVAAAILGLLGASFRDLILGVKSTKAGTVGLVVKTVPVATH